MIQDENEKAILLERARVQFGLPRNAIKQARQLAGDAGTRRYFRLEENGSSQLLAVYPEANSTPQRHWTLLQQGLSTAGVRVPRIYADSPQCGLALIEDFGDRDLSLELAPNTRQHCQRILADASRVLERVRSLSESVAQLNPPFDAAFFKRELDHTRHWALERNGRNPLPESQGRDWEALAGQLCEAAASGRNGPMVPTHRDYHANNIIRCQDGALGIIDFQDLRLGPRAYDEVSLRFERDGIRAEDDPQNFPEAVLLQRAWKVLGTFEKMLEMGRNEYRRYRDTTLAVLRRATLSGSPHAPMLGFLSRVEERV